jgi:hypothetical protein
MNKDIVTERNYKKFSSEKRIKIQLAKRNVFNLELDAVEKMRTSRKLNELEKEILKYQQNYLQENVWLCDREIYYLYDNNPINKRICKKMEDANVPKWPYIAGIPTLETKIDFSKYEPVDAVKALIIIINILKQRAETIEKKLDKSLKLPKINEYERSFLAYRLSCLKAELRINCNEIYNFCYKYVPNDYPYWTELLEEIQDAEIKLDKTSLILFLKSEYPSVTKIIREIPEDLHQHINYVLKKILKAGVLDKNEILKRILKADASSITMREEEIDARARKKIVTIFLKVNVFMYTIMRF